MPDPVIINASPLIFLARSRHIHLLQHLHRPILVPQPVVQEIRARGPDDPTVRTLNETAWLEVAPVPAIPSEILVWDLGPGESAVLALAWSIPGSIAYLNDPVEHGLQKRILADAKNSQEIPAIGRSMDYKVANEINPIANCTVRPK
ncbi:MAG: DUF3368 domain-containing protein [Magnetococcales bacterium]|nr:DUF3368 domain-containing protein [Magnetococcales bacterium]